MKVRCGVVFDPVKVLNVAPRWLRRLLLSVSEGRGPLGFLYDRLVHGYQDEQIPHIPSSSSRVRFLIGPANEAEQGYQWARGLERNLPEVSAIAMMGIDPGGYGVKADVRVPTSVYLRAPAWHEAFERYLESCTHIVFESGLPLLGRRYHSDFVTEARRFQSAGVTTGIMFHGSDVRLPSQHSRDSPWSPFASPGLPNTVLEEKARNNISRAAELGVPTFVSTPDLLQYVPGAVWCPVVIDPAEWRTTRGDWPLRPPVVLHAPSNSLIKGSALIEPMLRTLEAEGLIEYRRVVGLKYEQMRHEYASADIVLDQFLIGNYGVATCEAMASGCLVIGHVDDFTRDAVKRFAGIEIPVIEATVNELDAVLRKVLASKGRSAAGYRERGVRFVEHVHSGRYSAEALRPFLGLDVANSAADG